MPRTASPSCLKRRLPPPPLQIALSQLYIALDDGETSGIVRCMAGLGMDFSAIGGGAAEPALVAKMAAIMFDTRCPKPRKPEILKALKPQNPHGFKTLKPFKP